MPPVHALSDDQVGQELRKMTQFIRQEATEKAREIELKADEEFAIEKSKLVRQEQGAIDLTYEKKFKAAAMSQQITRSTVANKTRLKVLSAKQELLDNIFEATSKRLYEPSKDVHKYQEILKNLILEGFFALNESRVKIRARRADYGIVKKAIEVACEELEQDISIIIDEQNPLSEGCAGGVAIVGGGGKIEINNTFDERLKLLREGSLPVVRMTLFGKNQNRRFTD